MARGFSHAPGASPEVRAALDPARTKAELLTLGASRNTVVRAAVGSRPDCPLGLMVTLAHDYSVEVRCAVASNDHALRSVLQYLAADKHVDVVLTVIDNPALPEDLLDELAFHKKPQVRAAAAARMDVGAPTVPAERPEDSHVPELMDAAALYATQEASRMLREQAAANGRAVAEAQAALVEPQEHDEDEPHVAQFHHHHEVPIGTRTAPVRGFRPPSS